MRGPAARRAQRASRPNIGRQRCRVLVAAAGRVCVTWEQEQLIDRAETELVNRCLGRLGLKYELSAPSKPPFQRNARRYGIAAEARARALGYSAPEITKRPPRPDPPTHIARVIGGACKREAVRKINEGIADSSPYQKATDLGFATLDHSERDSRVRAAFGKWSACMKESGYNYPTPRAANGDDRFVDDREHRVTNLEIAVAVADVRCKWKTDLIGIWAGVETAYQRIAIAQNKAMLESARSILQTRLSNAAKV